MSAWSNLLNKTAYYKTVSSYADGAITYSTLQTCIATWENVSRTIKNGQGQEIIINTEIISESEIPEQSLFWEASADTSDNSKARTVMATNKYYNKLSGETMYVSWL